MITFSWYHKTYSLELRQTMLPNIKINFVILYIKHFNSYIIVHNVFGAERRVDILVV